MIYYDYKSIQQDAQQRVLDMQKKAREDGGDNSSHQKGRPENRAENHGRHQADEHHGGRRDATSHGHGDNEKSQVEKLKDKLFGPKELDIEAVLLIGLVALLISEGADMMLIASLLYII